MSKVTTAVVVILSVGAAVLSLKTAVRQQSFAESQLSAYKAQTDLNMAQASLNSTAELTYSNTAVVVVAMLKKMGEMQQLDNQIVDAVNQLHARVMKLEPISKAAAKAAEPQIRTAATNAPVATGPKPRGRSGKP